MWKIYVVVVPLFLFTSFFVEIFAVNSPQMTFFTSPAHEQIIHLESKYGNSATLKLTREAQKTLSLAKYSNSKPHISSSNSTNQRKILEFLILGPDYPFHGVSAIIQEMNLRTSKENFGCTDFVQFSVNSTGAGQTNKICGQISRDTDWNGRNNTDSRLQRSFFSPSGTIHLYFYSDFLDKDNYESNHSDKSTTLQEQDIGIEIVFTSYTDCPNPANSWKKLKPCSGTEKMSCIYSTLFCDSKVDCGFSGEFGIDEEVGGVLVTVGLIYLFLRWVTKIPKEYQ